MNVISLVKKIKGWLTIVIFFGLSLIFAETLINDELFSERYGMNPSTVGATFMAGEVAFILGIVIMLKATGIFKVGLKDIVKYDFSNMTFHSKEFIWGFVLNRLGAFIPWIYVLGIGWRTLPMTLIGMIVMELVVVVILTLGVFEVTWKNAAKKG